MFHFAQPPWILIGLCTCLVLLFLFHRLRKQRTELLGRFAAAELLGRLTRNVSDQRRLIKKFLFLTAVFCCFVALARPQYGHKWVDVKRKGIDILFALDTSKSMLAQDIKPNRLERAKLGIMDFVSQLDGDRVGLLPFAGSAYLMCPLTMDYNAFEQSLNAIDTSIIPQGGTNLGTAIAEAEKVLNNQANHKILILITDGENLAGDAVEAAAKANENELKIFTVGVGTREGELIPDSAQNGSPYKKDEQGKFVTSKLDEATLGKIAETTGAIYAPLGNKGQGLSTIYREKLTLVPREELAEKRTKVPLERFEWPLLAALALLMVEFLISSRKSTLSIKVPFVRSLGRRSKKTIIKTALLFVCLKILTIPETGFCSLGETAFEKGDYITASQYYSDQLEKNSDDPRLLYNYGTAAYKNNLFDEAIASFDQALKTDDLDLQAKSYYNKGNALFKKGAETIQTDPQHTIDNWQSAIDAYNAVLALKKNDQDGLFNRDLVTKKLEELKKQQEQSKQNNQDNQDDKEDQKDNSNQDQQSSDSQSDEKNENDPQAQQQESKSENPESVADSGDQKEKEKKENNEQQMSDSEQKKETEPQAEKEGDIQPLDQNEEDREDRGPQAETDEQRRLQGKMTREDAERLLQGLKDEESELNFVPAASSAAEPDPRRDW